MKFGPPSMLGATAGGRTATVGAPPVEGTMPGLCLMNGLFARALLMLATAGSGAGLGRRTGGAATLISPTGGATSAAGTAQSSVWKLGEEPSEQGSTLGKGTTGSSGSGLLSPTGAPTGPT